MPLLLSVHLPVIALPPAMNWDSSAANRFAVREGLLVSTTHFGHVLPRRSCSKNFASKLPVLDSKAMGTRIRKSWHPKFCSRCSVRALVKLRTVGELSKPRHSCRVKNPSTEVAISHRFQASSVQSFSRRSTRGVMAGHVPYKNSMTIESSRRSSVYG
jgi:hypothetical protein